MMSELRKIYLLADENDIRIRTQYIRSAANIWADKLSRGTDTSDRQLAPRVFRHLDSTFYKRTIDIVASRENKQLPRYLQRQVERRHIIGGGRTAPPRSRMEKGGKFVQPSLVPPRRLGSETKAVGSSGNRHRLQVAKVPVVPTSRRDGNQDRRDATSKKPYLSAAERGARGGRALCMERRDIQTATPLLMLLTGK